MKLMAKSVVGNYTKDQTEKKGTVALLNFLEVARPGLSAFHVFNIKPIFGDAFPAVIFGDNLSVLGYVMKNIDNLFRLRFIQVDTKYSVYGVRLANGITIQARTLSEASVIARNPNTNH